MPGSKLQELLRTLNKHELLIFKDFVESKYFNKSRLLITYFEEILPSAPEFVWDENFKTKIHSKIYPDKKYKDGNMRNFQSGLLELLIEFITYENLKHDEADFLYRQLTALNARKAEFLVEKKLKEAITYLKMTDETTVERFLHKQQFMEEEVKFILTRSHSRYEDTLKADMEMMIQTTFDTALLHIYRYNLNAMQRRSVSQSSYNEARVEESIQLFDLTHVNDREALMPYYLLNKLMHYKHDEDYFKLKKILFKNNTTIKSVRDRTDISIVMNDFCSDKIKSGNFKWEEESFELYEFIIKNNIWYPGISFSYILFYSIVGICGELKKFDLAEKFIAEYTSKLHEPIRKEVAALSKARILFFEKKYTETSKLLSLIKPNSNQIKYELKVLQAQLFYTTEAWDQLFYLLDNFRHFLMYNKEHIGKYNFEYYKNFIEYIQKIYKLNFKSTHNKNSKLVSELNEAHVYQKKWLLSQIE